MRSGRHRGHGRDGAARGRARLLTRRSWVGVAGGALIAMLGCRQPPPDPLPDRIVSLAPSITETLFAIGAGNQVVGVSDYCDYPPEVQRRTRAGTILTPNYEAIARLRPMLVIGERARNVRPEQLESLARTRLLPWLTVSDAVASTRELGQITGHRAEAEALAQRLASRLTRPAPAGAPRVLVALGSDPEQRGEVWFIRDNSLHGAALRAAGVVNAVPEEIRGVPRLSLEQVIARDPEIVIILVPSERLEPAVAARYEAGFRDLPITAARRGAVRVIHGKAVESTGPRILDLVEQLSAAVREMAPRPR